MRGFPCALSRRSGKLFCLCYNKGYPNSKNMAAAKAVSVRRTVWKFSAALRFSPHSYMWSSALRWRFSARSSARAAASSSCPSSCGCSTGRLRPSRARRSPSSSSTPSPRAWRSRSRRKSNSTRPSPSRRPPSPAPSSGPCGQTGSRAAPSAPPSACSSSSSPSSSSGRIRANPPRRSTTWMWTRKT